MSDAMPGKGGVGGGSASQYRRSTEANDPATASIKGAHLGANSSWVPFFGVPQNNLEVRPYDERDETTWVLPDAYLGQNTMISNGITHLQYVRDSFYTQELLPIEKWTGGTGSVKWSTIEFGAQMAAPVPELAPYRLIHSKRITGKAAFTRRSHGFLLEWGFMNTPEGRELYGHNLDHLNSVITETMSFDVLYTILTAHDTNRLFLRDRRYMTRSRMRDVLDREAATWNIIKKRGINGIELLDTHISENIERYGGAADTYIMAPPVAVYLTQAIPDRFLFSTKGALGPRTLTDGVASFNTFRGQRIYRTRTFAADSRQDGGAPDIMRFNTQIGEYHCAYDSTHGSHKDYTSDSRTIQVYDEDNDTFADLSQSFFIENMQRHDTRPQDVQEMLSLEQAGSAARYDTGVYSNDDRAQDPFMYVNANNKIVPCRYWGQVGGYNLATTYQVAQTVWNQVLEATGYSSQEATSAWMGGVRAVELMEKQPVNEFFSQFAGGLKNQDTVFQKHPGSIDPGARGCKPISTLYEFAPTSTYGTLALPVFAGYDEPTYEGKYALPPMYGSYAGLQTLRAYGDSGVRSILAPNSKQWIAQIDKFLTIFDATVETLTRAFPNSPLIDANYASSWWHQPDAGTVLFENTIARRSIPAFVYKKDALPDDVVAPTAEMIGAGLSGEFVRQSDSSKRFRDTIMSNAIGQIDTATLEFSGVDENDVPILATAAIGRTAGVAGESAAPPKPLTNAAQHAYAVLFNYTFKGLPAAKMSDMASDGEALELLARILAYTLGLATLSLVDVVNVQSAEEAAARVMHVNKWLSKSPLSEPDQDPEFPQPMPITGAQAVAFVRNFRKYVAKNPTYFRGEGSSVVSVVNGVVVAHQSHVARYDRTAARQHEPSRPSSAGRLYRYNPDEYLRAPLVMSGAQYRSFVDNFTRKGKFSYVVPASLDNPDAPATVDELMSSVLPGAKRTHPLLEPFSAPISISRDGSVQAVRNMTRLASHADYATSVRSARVANMGDAQAARALVNDAMNGRAFGAPIDQTLAEQARAERQYVGADDGGGGVAHSRHADTSYDPFGGAGTDSMSGARAREAALGLGELGQCFEVGRDVLLQDEVATTRFVPRFEEIQKRAPSAPLRAIATAFMFARTDLATWRAMDVADVKIPANWIVARPHCRYQSLAIVKMKRGPETGKTLIGPTRFTLADDGTIGYHTGHFDWYHVSYISEPKNVWIERYAFIDGYKGGRGVVPYSPTPVAYSPHEGRYGAGSVFVMVTGADERPASNPFSITGKFHFMAFAGATLDGAPARSALHYSTAVYYNALWGWYHNGVGESVSDAREDEAEYFNELEAANSIVWHGHTFRRRGNDGTYAAYTPQTGHVASSSVHIGQALVNAGQALAYKDQEWSTLNYAVMSV